MNPLFTVENKEPNKTSHILLVDGDIEIQAVLMVLLKTKFLVSTALTISEGFSYLNVFSPDLVILDLSLSPFEGTYFIRNRSGRALVMLQLGLMEPLERRGARTEQAHRAVPPHTQR